MASPAVTRKAAQQLLLSRCSSGSGVQRAVIAVLSSQRRHGSSGHGDKHHFTGPTAYPDEWLKVAREKLFFNSTGRRFALLGLFAAGLYQLNVYITADQDEHPFTRLLGSLIKSTEETDKEMTAVVHDQRKKANDQLILSDRPRDHPHFHRIRFPDLFYRASDHLIEPGSQIDLSDLKIKHTWQEDDDLFGPPFPKNA
ncbi:hypothetical protein BC829DRAFT_443903 [Chytridium lagenaria]|nr:hypothetical protein BC829DRAFT_443903 [Chytridium lagenaria]